MTRTVRPFDGLEPDVGEIVFRWGDEIVGLPDDVKLWLILEHIEALSKIKSPALTSLFRHNVRCLAQQRNAFYRWGEEGLEKVTYGDEFIESLISFAIFRLPEESDEKQDSGSGADGVDQGDSES